MITPPPEEPSNFLFFLIINFITLLKLLINFIKIY